MSWTNQSESVDFLFCDFDFQTNDVIIRRRGFRHRFVVECESDFDVVEILKQICTFDKKNDNKRRKNNFEPRRIEETFRESPSHQLHLLSTQHHESALCTCTNTSFKVLMHFSKSTHALTCTSSPSLTPSAFALLPPLAKSQPNWRKFERIH